MNVVDFGQGKCEQMRQQLDAYLSNELLVETSRVVAAHLERCAACAAELEQRRTLRDALRRAVSSQAVPAGLEERVRRQLRSPGAASSRWVQWGAIAAALVLTAVGVGGAFQVREHYVAARATNENLLKVGMGNHVHCALHYEPEKAPSEEAMRDAMGEEYFALVGAVRSQLGDFEIKQAHRCSAYKRRFVHLILRRGGELVSLSLTRREAGEDFAASLLLPTLKASGAVMHNATLENLEITGFAVPGHLAYVTSNLPAAQNQALAAQIAAALREVAEKAPRA